MTSSDESARSDQITTEHVCVRCGQTFSVGTLLYIDKDLSKRGSSSKYCNDCLSRPRIGRKIGALFELLDFGINLYWFAAVIITLILGLLLRNFGGK